MKHLTEDEKDQINEAYQHRDDVIGIIVGGLGFIVLVCIIAFSCYVVRGEG